MKYQKKNSSKTTFQDKNQQSVIPFESINQPSLHPIQQLHKTIGNRAICRMIQKKQPVHLLQQTIGNRAMNRIIQTRFAIGQLVKAGEEKQDKPLDNQTLPFIHTVTGKKEESKHREAGKWELLCSIQEKLGMGNPGDVFEQEAEKIAVQVAGYANSNNFKFLQQLSISRFAIPEIFGLVHKPGQKISQTYPNKARCLQINRRKDRIGQDKEILSSSIEHRILQSKGKGRSLPLKVRDAMEIQTGYDFSTVRVKTDAEAAYLNQSLNSRAFTLGSDIWLGKNESINDVRLMAHELTHVVQQGAAMKINPKSAAGFDNGKSKSKVMTYLQKLANGKGHDPAIYAKKISQFSVKHFPEKIAELQQKILEKSNTVDIKGKSDSRLMRQSVNPENARPINFRQETGFDVGGGILRFWYSWGSSTGNLEDLSNCEVGEHVSYPECNCEVCEHEPYFPNVFHFPSPPFPSKKVSNPTINWTSGTNAACKDDHYPGGDFVRPYKASSFTATQYYRYRLNRGTPVNLMGPIFITREVIEKHDGSFKYKITKNGVSAEFDLLPE